MNTKQKVIGIIVVLLKMILYCLVVLVLVQTSKTCYSVGYRIFNEQPVSTAPGKEMTLTINSDIGYKKIAELLEDKKIIQSARIFEIQCVIYEYDDKFKSGSYIISNSMKNRNIMGVLAGEIDISQEEEN